GSTADDDPAGVGAGAAVGEGLRALRGGVGVRGVGTGGDEVVGRNPSAGFVIGGTERAEGSAGHGCSSGRPPLPPNGWFGSGGARLSQATMAFTRGSHCPIYETPAAP